MKKITVILVRTVAVGIVFTQLLLAVCGALGLNAVCRQPVISSIYLLTVLVLMIVQTLRMRQPAFPAAKLGALLETEGYTAEFYSILFAWCNKCNKSSKPQADLAAAELLIDGGHCAAGFKRLKELDFASLTEHQKQVYYNTYLYGALICGDREAADLIYNSGKNRLLSVESRPLAASVRHTLGCYEYTRGRIMRAEELFMQALDSARSDDVICEIWLALTLCYLDTERPQNAAAALRKAAEHAFTLPLKQKVSRLKELAEM